jgi:pimeloyl-ACP methyl ester carboxylesterase
LLPSKDNQARLLADPKNIQSLKDLIWTIWPFSKRRDGFYNDYEQFSNLTLPLSAIKVPTIIIHGDEDINVDLEQAEYLDKFIPNSKLHIIKGADHYMLSTHKNEIDIIIDNFIEEVSK